jgi:hypothetical protein
MKVYQYIKSIDNDEISKTIEPKIQRVIIDWKSHTLHPRFIKHENWIGVCCENNELYENMNVDKFLKAIQLYESLDVTVFSFSQYFLAETKEMLPRGYSFPAHMKAFQELWCSGFLLGPSMHIYFAGEPDWILLNDPDLDYFVVFAEPQFIEQILPLSIDDAFSSILIKSDNHPFYYSWHDFFASLVHQLRDIYPNAKPGDIIEI